MNIIFDHQIFTLQSYGGISRYHVRLAQGLLALGEQVDIVAPIHRNRYLKDLPSELVHGFEFERFPPKTSRLAMMLSYQLSKKKVARIAADILHETYYSPASVSTKPKGKVLTVHDMIHEKFPKNFSPRDATTRYKQSAVTRADHIIAISHSTKKDLCEIFSVPEHKVTVVHHGFERFGAQPIDSSQPRPAGRPFLLYVGSRGGYKNFEFMLRAVASSPTLQNAFDVVAFGGGVFSRAECELISQLGFQTDAVRQVSGNDAVLGCLYSQARAFVYPSIYEGFGLPPLEAMAHDCPVVSSNSSSMPEVVGDAGVYFDPLDIEGQAQAIADVVFDDQRHRALVAAGRERLTLFSWERCAHETLAVYRKVLASKGNA